MDGDRYMSYDPGPEPHPSYGGEPPPNRREDLAESAAEHARYKPFWLKRSNERFIFIDRLLKTGEMLQP